MTADRHTEHNGEVRSEFFQGPDPAGLVTKNGPASIEVAAGHATNYGQTKCTVSVRLNCDQRADKFEQAFRVAFEAANNMAIEGMNMMVANGEMFTTVGRP